MDDVGITGAGTDRVGSARAGAQPIATAIRADNAGPVGRRAAAVNQVGCAGAAGCSAPGAGPCPLRTDRASGNAQTPAGGCAGQPAGRAERSIPRERRTASVTATEPVFGCMASALGLAMRNERFQLAVMNGTEPAASDVVAFEGDLRHHHHVPVLQYNGQATDASARRLLRIARAGQRAVVGVTKTEPPGKSYQAWITDQLDALAAALAKPGS
jgi:hypothetical protein